MWNKEMKANTNDFISWIHPLNKLCIIIAIRTAIFIADKNIILVLVMSVVLPFIGILWPEHIFPIDPIQHCLNYVSNGLKLTITAMSYFRCRASVYSF